MSILFAILLFAQPVFLPAYTVAYTDADGTARLGLATPNGTYGISLGDGCDWVGVGQNVQVFSPTSTSDAMWQTGDPAQQFCHFQTVDRVSDTPCQTNADGLCDVGSLP